MKNKEVRGYRIILSQKDEFCFDFICTSCNEVAKKVHLILGKTDFDVEIQNVWVKI